MRRKPQPRVVEIVHPSCQPSRAELPEDFRTGSAWEDFERAAKTLVRPVKVPSPSDHEIARSQACHDPTRTSGT